MIKNHLEEKCISAIGHGTVTEANKCWVEMMSGIRTYDRSPATEIKLITRLVADGYSGYVTQIKNILQFIQENIEKGSEVAYNAYSTLLNGMDKLGELYMKDFEGNQGYGEYRHTYRALARITEAEGFASPIFTEKLPSVVRTILTGKAISIQNSATKGYLYALPSNDSTVLLNNEKGNDSRYHWILNPAVEEWGRGRELFHIKNAFDNKILTVEESDNSLVLVEGSEENLKSMRALFYIRLIRGTTGKEVAIHCRYGMLKSVGLSENDGTEPKLLHLNALIYEPKVVWLLQSEVE